MKKHKLDRIVIRDLLVRCVIGIQEWERNTRQDVLINLTLYTDTRAPGQSDRIGDAVDYKKLTKKIITRTEQSQFFLVEALAEEIARVALEHPLVRQTRVTVEKPGALRFARSVGVSIRRVRPR
ncbi:MAG: dihydroneopterin aldolase [Magnetococcales bacterium]|nr:dihydroneopterin aldolase [Magnetococcales bacterium]